MSRPAVPLPLAAAPPEAYPSIAILPLENLGPDAQQYFADGMTEALATQLARIEALKVISRGAVMRHGPDAIAVVLLVATSLAAPNPPGLDMQLRAALLPHVMDRTEDGLLPLAALGPVLLDVSNGVAVAGARLRGTPRAS